VPVAEGAHLVELRGVAEDRHGEQRLGLRRQRALEHRDVHVERVELDVDEALADPIELQIVPDRELVALGAGNLGAAFSGVVLP
jgi:hypothetical protein